MANKKKNADIQLKEIGEKLKALRIKSGYSSYETFTHEHDLDRKQYGRIENGANLTLKTLVKILEIHKLTLSDFFQVK